MAMAVATGVTESKSADREIADEVVDKVVDEVAEPEPVVAEQADDVDPTKRALALENLAISQLEPAKAEEVVRGITEPFRHHSNIQPVLLRLPKRAGAPTVVIFATGSEAKAAEAGLNGLDVDGVQLQARVLMLSITDPVRPKAGDAKSGGGGSSGGGGGGGGGGRQRTLAPISKAALAAGHSPALAPPRSMPRADDDSAAEPVFAKKATTAPSDPSHDDRDPTAPADDLPVPAATAVNRPDPLTSALGDNIAKKGKHAYYYAHAHRANGPKWDGKIEPRLLSSASSAGAPTSASPPADGRGAVVAAPSRGDSRAALLEQSNITDYAFLDEDAQVKIYVPLPGVGRCREEDVALDVAERALCLTVRNYAAPPVGRAAGEVSDTAPAEAPRGEVRRLSLGRLYGRIEGATYRKKADKVIVTLQKKEGDKRTWRSVIV